MLAGTLSELRLFTTRPKNVFTISRARARQGENDRKSGMYSWHMSIFREFSALYRRSVADRKQVLSGLSAWRDVGGRRAQLMCIAIT